MKLSFNLNALFTTGVILYKNMGKKQISIKKVKSRIKIKKDLEKE